MRKAEIIWETRVDDRYDCKVVREDEHYGRLTVTETVGELTNFLLDREVGLAYGAVFGPDIGDVQYWQDICLTVIDGAIS